MVKKFEDLIVWQQAQKTSVLLIRFGNTISDHNIRNQLKRACLSVPLNIAEGFERGSRKEFMRFLRISLGSSSEIKAILLLIRDLAFCDAAEIEVYIDSVEHTKAILKRLLNSLQKAGLK